MTIPPGFALYACDRLCRHLDETWGSGLKFEVGFFEPALENAPHDVDLLVFLSHAFTATGRQEDGMRLDQTLARLRPVDPIVRYNLACSYALTGRKDLALESLRKAVDLGYLDFAYMARDRDLACLRQDPRFMSLLRAHSSRRGTRRKAENKEK